MKILFPQEIQLTSSSIADSAYANWDTNASYKKDDYVYVPENRGEYKCLDNNSGLDPVLNTYDSEKNPTGKWLYLGTTNKYKMFDKYATSQSVASGILTVQMVAVEAQAIFLGNLDAADITIRVVDNNTLQVIETFSKTLQAEATDWFDYFFGDWMENKKTQVVYERTTATRNISIVVDISNGASNSKCGIFCCGKVKKVGTTKWDVNVGSLDYSTSITDSTGDTTLLEGEYAPTLDIDMFANTANAMSLNKILNDARGKAVVFMAGYSDDLAIYGYKQKHTTLMSGPVETIITVNIIGLI